MAAQVPFKQAMLVLDGGCAPESLLANASETLGSATTMLNNFAALLDTSHRKTALGIAQVVMLGELAVNQALDKVVPAD
jgi:hypothetical protein